MQCKKCLSKAKAVTNTSRVNKHGMLTRGATTSLIRNAVFNTSELLENVLLQLSAKDILSARRVNVHFNALIMTSPRIQRKLFLLAEPVTTTWVFNSEDMVIKEGKGDDRNQPGIEWTIPAKLNHLLFTEQPRHLRASLKERVKTCESISLLMRPSLAKHRSIYHRMLISQPPTKEVEFELYYSKRNGKGKFRYYGDNEIRARVANETGVTFGDLVRAFQARLGPGTVEDPSSGYLVKVGPSVVFMGGVVFPTEDELAMVKKAAN